MELTETGVIYGGEALMPDSLHASTTDSPNDDSDRIRPALAGNRATRPVGRKGCQDGRGGLIGGEPVCSGVSMVTAFRAIMLGASNTACGRLSIWRI